MNNQQRVIVRPLMFTVSGSELWAYVSRKFPQEICHQFSIMFHSELLVADPKREVSADEAVYDITYYMSTLQKIVRKKSVLFPKLGTFFSK